MGKATVAAEGNPCLKAAEELWIKGEEKLQQSKEACSAELSKDIEAFKAGSPGPNAYIQEGENVEWGCWSCIVTGITTVLPIACDIADIWDGTEVVTQYVC